MERIDGVTDRQPYSQTDRQGDGQIDQTARLADRQAGRQRGTGGDKEVNRRTDRDMGRHR